MKSVPVRGRTKNAPGATGQAKSKMRTALLTDYLQEHMKKDPGKATARKQARLFLRKGVRQMAGMILTKILDEARKLKKVGEKKPFESMKPSRGELRNVQQQLGQDFSVEVTDEHELTITRIKVS